MDDLREIYDFPEYRCKSGFPLRQREWGDLDKFCTLKCDTCEIKNRKTGNDQVRIKEVPALLGDIGRKLLARLRKSD